MPIQSSQPETHDPMTSHPVVGPRLGGATDGIPLNPVPAPAGALALDALRVTRALRDPARRPARWAQPGFGQQVEIVRRHLAPVRTRRSLAASFSREAFHVVPTRTARDDTSPIRLAYALRWMELGDGATGPSWTTLFD
jgi:hypothetical protein